MRPRSDRLDLLAMAAMVVLCALWGLNQVTVKVANGGISPLLQAGLRSAGAAALVWAWSSARGVRLFRRDGSGGLGFLIAVLFAGEFAFLFWSLEFTNASRAVLFLYMAPFIVAIGAHWFIAGERLRGIHVAGLVAAFAGTAIAFADALRFPTYRELFGDMMAFIAAIFWGMTTVVIKASALSRLSPDKMLLYQLAGSAPLLLGLSLAVGEPGVFAPTPLVLACFLYQTIIVAFASYLCWFWLVAHYPAFKLASFSFLTPIFGLIAGGVVLGEPISAALILAMALVGFGIYLVNRTQPTVAARADAVTPGD